jgi:hypothetical protein
MERVSVRHVFDALRRKLEYSCPDALAIAALVVLFLFAHRFVDGIDIGGDAVKKWQFVRQWSYANDFSNVTWDHHMTRMGVNVVAWLVQKIFGSNWRSYYIAPMFMAALQLPFVYLLAKRLAGRVAGVLAALIIIYLPSVQLTVSQLLPDGFVGTYALIGTYLVVRLSEARARHRLPLLVALAFVAFVGYLAKETFFFFYPGFVVAVWLTRHSLRDVGIFLGVLLLQLGLETACYATFTKYSSRPAIVLANHFAAATDEEQPVVAGVPSFFEIFRNLDQEWRYVLQVAALGAIWLLVFNRRRPTQGRVIALIGMSHVVLLSVSTRLWQRPLPRYMDPALPFAALCAGILAATFIATVAATLTRLPGSVGKICVKASAWLGRWQIGLGAVLLTVSLAGWLTYVHQLKFPILDGVEHGRRMARLANRTYERNLPIVHSNRVGRVLAVFYDVYLHDKKLARDGVLPDVTSVRRRFHEHNYIVRDPSVYTHGIFERLLEAGCALELRRGSKSLGMKGCADTRQDVEPPAQCDVLLRELVDARRKQPRRGRDED